MKILRNSLSLRLLEPRIAKTEQSERDFTVRRLSRCEMCANSHRTAGRSERASRAIEPGYSDRQAKPSHPAS